MKLRKTAGRPHAEIVKAAEPASCTRARFKARRWGEVVRGSGLTVDGVRP